MSKPRKYNPQRWLQWWGTSRQMATQRVSNGWVSGHI